MEVRSGAPEREKTVRPDREQMVAFLAGALTSHFPPQGQSVWNVPLVWVNVVADAVIALACCSICVALVYIARSRKDASFRWMWFLFGAFLVACGATYFIEIVTFWIPAYGLESAIRAATAGVSLVAAVLLVRLVPRVVAIPSATELETTNRVLERQIVERRWVEEALRQSEERFRLMVDSVKDYAICLLDPDGRVVSWNAGAERIDRYRSEEIIGTHFSRFYPNEDIESGKPGRALRIALQEGRFEGEGWRVRKDGERFWAHVILTPLSDAAGRLRGFSKVKRDITERKRAEEALRHSEQYFRSLIENALDLIALLNDDGTVRYASPSHHAVLGYPSGDLIGLQAFDLIHPDDQSYVMEMFARIVGQPRVPQLVEFRFRHANGSWRILEARGNNLLDDPVVAAVVVNSRDVTERKQAEEEARQREVELAHLLRVSTIGEMAAGLAHEINQPLSAIVSYAKGSARRVQMGSGQSAELLVAMEEIAAQALRADQIVRRLRNFLRKEEPRRERVDLNDLIRDVARLVESDAREQGVGMRLSLAPNLPPVEGDGVQIEQVVLNLVRNGFEAMQDSDHQKCVLSIETGMREDEAVEVAVSDTGVGLPVEIAEKMFDPFFTTKANGLGMGLSISRTIVETHGGRLWAMPNRDRGTSFHFTVPLARNGNADVH